ncbi:GNAT family N-acetyltransferase [Pullulanibacillus sp. KACC 23026]|uniref:GNAT family N-acetyltransferase n=1 Tax=Pullulanibacillus sp. KACC 23026 TaxID=3028315 RepID=UPI0023B1C48D|nr:GNAT family N-acetyltransferase [Pullulanibacillus sp. KACC 23026]WEG12142.1 GNAT family N-acetyltransferase [Pullulanibacillus sp. KACC 23026]
MSFEFLEADRIKGEEIDLLIDNYMPGDLEKGWVPAYRYHIVIAGTNQIIGKIDLRIGEQESLYYGGHIGYSVDEEYRGHRYAGKACRLLKPIALKHGKNRLYITCNPTNLASRKTIERVGGKFIETVDLPPYNDMYQRGEREISIFEWILD